MKRDGECPTAPTNVRLHYNTQNFTIHLQKHLQTTSTITSISWQTLINPPPWKLWKTFSSKFHLPIRQGPKDVLFVLNLILEQRKGGRQRERDFWLLSRLCSNIVHWFMFQHIPYQTRFFKSAEITVTYTHRKSQCTYCSLCSLRTW
jgi:hypothetical protein